MSKSNIEWNRNYVTKYSNITKMKNGLRKVYFYENECKHHSKSYQRLPCPLCQSLFECCRKCYADFSETDVNVESWEDLICPDCIEKCHKCCIYVSEENGTRSDNYPYELYCDPCANQLGFCYDSPDELQPNNFNKHNNNESNNEDEDESDNE